MEIVELALAIFAGTSATVGFATLVRAGWVRTIGRRRHARDLVERITPGLRLSYVESVLGPARTRNEVDGWVEWVWIDPLYYVQICGRGDSDCAERIAVTSRDLRFRPGVNLGSGNVRLHKSTFADAIGSDGEFVLHWGARRFVASESKYLANPGSYLTLAVAASDAAASKNLEVPAGESAGLSGAYTDADIPAVLRHFRETTTINTFSISGRGVGEDPFTLGADLDNVRYLSSK
ncbi:MAG: ETEC_3214 domain-containing protein [Ilumatobacter sp.]|uniref:ETEC_3214 domain-containing protein n=1 Tax=Ilumatobacter sp. TaxID=1967498 RepID=UPI0039195790